MNVLLYKQNEFKRINGTLFYTFEYFLFLKQYVSDLKFYIITNSLIDDIKNILTEKYAFDVSILQDVLCISKLKYYEMTVQNAMMLDVDTYDNIKDFLGKTKNVYVYSHRSHKHLNEKSNVCFYGWYDYQNFNKKTRLKFFLDCYKTYDVLGDKVFLSHLNGNTESMIHELQLNRESLLVKRPNEHNPNLFERVGKIIYYHTGCQDTNNRTVVESFIYKIPLQLHLRGYNNDSVYERFDTIQRTGLKEFKLDVDDIMIQDFLNGCDSICQ